MCAQVYQSSNVDETFEEGKRAVSILKLSFDVEFFSNEILITLISFFFKLYDNIILLG